MVMSTTSEVIRALGGPREVARLVTSYGYRAGYNAVTNWKTRGKFPCETFLIMTSALRERDLGEADPSLWGIIPPSSEIDSGA